MDEDEELYRQMNEEDDFYMGDKKIEKEDENYSSNSQKNNSGCAGIFLILFLLSLSFMV